MERMLYIGGDFMRKKFSLIILFLMCTSLLVGCTENIENSTSDVYAYDEVKDSLIRFHVIANSDTEEEQNLKLKVRDGIIEYLYPYLNKAESIEESRAIISEREDEVVNLAIAIVRENGYSYGVTSELSRENFPEKAYGKIVLPQGNYEAFRVVIGEGQGKNWWCVMFPPLCFVDITKGKVQEENSKKALDEQVAKFKDQEKDKEVDDKPVIKFKILEIFKSIFD